MAKTAKKRRTNGKAAADRLRSLAEVAKRFGVSTKTVENWRANGMPGTRGNYSAKAVASWRDKSQRKTAANTEVSEARRGIFEAERRVKEANANLREIEVAERQASIVHLADVENFIAELLAEIRRQHEKIPVDMFKGVEPKIRTRIRKSGNAFGKK